MRDNQTTRRMPMIVTAMACATASMLAGLALGPSAMAADTTITLQGADGASLAGHTFNVYRIGTYTDQILNGTRISSLGVRGDTASNAWAADAIGITFIITNTSKTDPATGDGAWFKASDLNLADSTIVGDAHVDMDSLTYPDNWDTLVLKPGESVSVTGTLKGVKEGDTHTDRAIVTGTPLVECAPSNGDPFNDKTDGGEDTDPEYSTGDVTEIDGKQLCADTQTASNTDDWNGYRAKPLASTGTAVLGLAGGALAVLLAGGSLLVFRKRHYAQGSGRHTAVNAGK